MQGWPKIAVEIWSVNSFGQKALIAYGYVNVPLSPGLHNLDLVTWRPTGSIWEWLLSRFTSSTSILNHTDVVYSDIDRLELDTTTCGVVHIELQVLLIDFESTGLQVFGGTGANFDAAAPSYLEHNHTCPLGQWIVQSK